MRRLARQLAKLWAPVARRRGPAAADVPAGAPRVDAAAASAQGLTFVPPLLQGYQAAVADWRAGRAPRRVVAMSPDGTAIVYPVPLATAPSAAMTAAIERITPAQPKRRIVVVARGEAGPTIASLSSAVPFAGYLLGLAHAGHFVFLPAAAAWEVSSLCGEADLLLVDDALLPGLPRDWLPTNVPRLTMKAALIFSTDGRLRRVTAAG